MDIVFHASSLNYDQGSGNYQELKKITKWDGKQYTLVSRYALRYSILHWADKLFDDWKLAKKKQFSVDQQVVQPSPKLLDKENGNIFDYPEFDLFGWMSTKKESAANTRTAPVKLSHAISVTPFNFDSHFSANLGMANRSENEKSINPTNIEEKKDFYIYNITMDLDRIGKFDGSDKNEISKEEKRKRIKQLVESIFSLKREIKGRMEDLSPWFAVIGLYNNEKYASYLDRIEISKSNSYKIITKKKETTDSEGRNVQEVENETVEKQNPKFIIDSNNVGEQVNKEELIGKINDFVSEEKNSSKVFNFKSDFVSVETTSQK